MHSNLSGSRRRLASSSSTPCHASQSASPGPRGSISVGLARLERLEIEVEPPLRRRPLQLAPAHKIRDRLPPADPPDQVLLMPARKDDQLARIVVHAGLDHRGVPLPAILPHDRRIGLHRILVEVVQDEAVDPVSGQRPFAADREQTAPAADDLHLVGRAQVFGRSCPPLDGGLGEECGILGGVDDPLHAAIELRGERGRIGGDGQPQVGIAPQQVGGQQRRRSDTLAVLGRHRHDQAADAPLGKCLQNTIVGSMEPLQLQKGVDPRGKVAKKRDSSPAAARASGERSCMMSYIRKNRFGYPDIGCNPHPGESPPRCTALQAGRRTEKRGCRRRRSRRGWGQPAEGVVFRKDRI